MYEKLYKNTNFVIEELPPFDLNENRQLHMYGPNYPPHGDLVYPPVDMNSLYYAVRAKLLTTWIPCKVTERLDTSVDGVRLCDSILWRIIRSWQTHVLHNNRTAF